METGHEGQLAVITGASSGIGFELAKVFAEEGFDLLIAAEDAELTTALEDLKRLGANVEAHRVDLATEAGVIELHRHVQNTGRPVEALALNAGIGAGGAFATETELADELKLIDLNVRSTVHNASKSFVQSFALALRNELKDTGIAVTSLMPGATETEFFERAGMEDTAVGAGEKDDPAEVARQGFDALMADRERVVAGAFKNKAQVAASRVLPDGVKAEKHRAMAEPGSAGEEDR
jgi:uncharacterized protein